MDGGASVVLYSENKVELLSWYSAIKDRVVMLLEQSVSYLTVKGAIYVEAFPAPPPQRFSRFS